MKNDFSTEFMTQKSYLHKICPHQSDKETLPFLTNYLWMMSMKDDGLI